MRAKKPMDANRQLATLLEDKPDKSPREMQTEDLEKFWDLKLCCWKWSPSGWYPTAFDEDADAMVMLLEVLRNDSPDATEALRLLWNWLIVTNIATGVLIRDAMSEWARSNPEAARAAMREWRERR